MVNFLVDWEKLEILSEPNWGTIIAENLEILPEPTEQESWHCLPQTNNLTETDMWRFDGMENNVRMSFKGEMSYLPSKRQQCCHAALKWEVSSGKVTETEKKNKSRAKNEIPILLHIYLEYLHGPFSFSLAKLRCHQENDFGHAKAFS